SRAALVRPASETARPLSAAAAACSAAESLGPPRSPPSLQRLSAQQLVIGRHCRHGAFGIRQIQNEPLRLGAFQPGGAEQRPHCFRVAAAVLEGLLDGLTELGPALPPALFEQPQHLLRSALLAVPP